MGRERKWGLPEVPESLRATVDRLASEWERDHSLERIWSRDASLWTGGDEHQWLGWLNISNPGTELMHLHGQVSGFSLRDVVLLGMGGSSLGTEVLRAVLPAEPAAPRLHVLDSTDPYAVDAVLQSVDPDRTLLLNASKSGKTLETRVLASVFEKIVPPERRIAITDPDTELVRHARAEGYLATVLSHPSIGGRFSVLSPFGTVPAILSGRPVKDLLEGAREMAGSCHRSDPLENPGCLLGLTLAAALSEGRFRLGIGATGSWRPFALWLEQLLAESLGKEGKGFVPVHSWPSGTGDALEIEVGPFGAVSSDATSGRKAGNPRIEIHCSGAARLGAEFFRWQFATAVCGAACGIHPFDQPDVEAAKKATVQVTADFARSGNTDFFDRPGLRAVVRSAAADVWGSSDLPFEDVASGPSLQAQTSIVSQFVAESRTDGYLAVLDYLPFGSSGSTEIQAWAKRLEERLGVAVSIGLGPRYLHSVGQAYKGGPAVGRFLFLTQRVDSELRVSAGSAVCAGMRLADVRRAQAAGDAEALAQRQRPVLVVEFGGEDADLPKALLESC